MNGEVTDAGGAEITKHLALNDAYNPKSSARFHVSLKPQEKRELTFTFKRIV